MKRIIASAICISLMLSGYAQAATVGCVDGGITVSEKNLAPNTEYSVILVNPGKALTELDGKNDTEIISYVGFVKSDENGNYLLNIGLDGDSEPGLYTIYGEDTETSFYWASLKEKQKALAVFSSTDEDAAEEVYSYLSNPNAVYGIFGSKVSAYADYYALLSEQAQRLVSARVGGVEISGRTDTVKNADIELSSVLSNFFAVCKTVFADYGFAAIRETLNAENVLDILEKYNDVFELDMKRLETTEEYKEQLCGTLKAKTSLTAEELRKLCYEQTAVYKVNRLTSFDAGEIVNIITNNPDVFGENALTECGYSGLSSTEHKNAVLLKAAEKSDYKTAADIVSAISSAVKNINTSYTPSVTPRPSSGGGGGSVQMRPDTSAKKDNEDLDEIPKTYSFIDMADYAWAKEAVENLYTDGFISGVSDKEFEPARSIRREEFLAMALRIFGTGLMSGEVKFADIANGAWYADYVNTAYAIGVVNGISDTEFGAGNPITRQDAAVILHNLMKVMKKEFSSEREVSFTDYAEVSDYAKDAVEVLAAAGIINGNENAEFMPNGLLSRAESAVMLYAYTRRK